MTAAAVIAGGMTVAAARKPPKYTASVVLLVRGGLVQTGANLGTARLRAQMTDLTFTRAGVANVIERHADDLPHGDDPGVAYEALIDRIRVEIVEDDVIRTKTDEDEDRGWDRPLVAHVTLSFTGWKPKVVFEIVHELADLLIDTALGRQRASMLREQAAAESAVGLAQATSDDAPGADKRTAVERVKKEEGNVAGAQLGVHAMEQKQGLHFEMVDPGRVPKTFSKASLIGDGITMFLLLLLAAGLLAGAFDPRVLDADDLPDLGVALIGRLPPLPIAHGGAPQAQRNAPDASSAPSAGSRPSV